MVRGGGVVRRAWLGVAFVAMLFFAVPAAADVSGQEIGAVRGVLAAVLSMIERGATHIGVATIGEPAAN